MQSKTISICVAVLAGVTASIGVAIFAPRTSADENSALPAGSASESVVESADSPSIAESIVESEVSSTEPKNTEESKVDSSSSEAASSKTEESSSEAVSTNTQNSSSQAASSTYIASDGTKITINYSVEDTHPNSKVSESMPAAPNIATPNVAVPGVDGARPVANDPATPTK